MLIFRAVHGYNVTNDGKGAVPANCFGTKLYMNGNVLSDLENMHETLWINDDKAKNCESELKHCELRLSDIADAEERLLRFAPLIKRAFPETEKSGGIIESPLVKVERLGALLEADNVYMKLDSSLPISGSIKARGGIYEVLKHTEDIAFREGLITKNGDYSELLSEKSKRIISKYSIAVGSTGNLGLSIGIMAAKLGFNVIVHMSSDAREWKKEKLRSCGCTVREYESDYSVAVSEGRRQAEKDPLCYFIDDENSKTLFLGYAVAGLRLKKQLENLGIAVDSSHPLYVYLPCGVGGGPGGVAFGIMHSFSDNAHCFFAEPTHAPCMTLGMCTGKQSEICVADIGLDGKTAADGLAVGRASGFVGNIMKRLIDGCFTVSDERMYYYLAKTYELEGIKLEPSALAGCLGVSLMRNVKNAAHIIWATGGSMVPDDIMEEYIEHGRSSLV